MNVSLECTRIPSHLLFAAYTVDPLPPGNWTYRPPIHSGLCKCNTVAYSLFSACSACQDGQWDKCESLYALKPSFMHLLSGGLYIQPTAQRFCLLLRRFPMRQSIKHTGTNWTIWPQLPQHRSAGNGCTSMGPYRRHGSLLSTVLDTY